MSSVEEIRADRPPEPGVARAMLIVAVVLWVPITGYMYGTGGGLIFVAMFFVVFGSFGAVKGRQAGRIMTTVAVVPLAVLLLSYCWVGFEDEANPYGTLYAMIDIAAVLLSGWAVSLLYHPNTNRYVQSVTTARAAG